MAEICTDARCEDCGEEWCEPLFAYINPETAREVLCKLAEHFENLKCLNCGSKNIWIGGTAYWD